MTYAFIQWSEVNYIYHYIPVISYDLYMTQAQFCMQAQGEGAYTC